MRTPADGLPRLVSSAWMRCAAASVTDKACFLARIFTALPALSAYAETRNRNHAIHYKFDEREWT
jgi:hypothetical protein